MKDIHSPLRALLVSLLASEGLTVYENGAVPDNAATPYVIIAEITSLEKSNKSRLGNSVQVLLDVVTSYLKPRVAGSAEVDLLAGKVLNLINSKSELTSPDAGLQVMAPRVLQDTKVDLTTSTHKIYRRLLRFHFNIMEV